MLNGSQLLCSLAVVGIGLAGSPGLGQDCTLVPDGTPTPGLRATGYHGSMFPPKVVSFTYDDGPTHLTLPIAQYLHDEAIRATFFAVTGHHGVGPASSPCVELGRRPLEALPVLKQLGHRVGQHTHNHQSLDYAAVDVKSQVCEAQRIVDDPAVSDGLALFRPPGGCWDDVTYCCPSSGGSCQAPSVPLREDPSFNRIVGPIDWNLSIQVPGSFTSDIDCHGAGHTPEYCGDNLLMQLDSGPVRGGIVLFHDFLYSPNACPVPPPPPGQKSWTSLLAEYLLPRLKQRHYLILPLDADPELPGGMLYEPLALWTTNFSDGDGWNSSAGYYGTFRLGDVDGDGRLDVCARGFAGVYCSRSTGQGFETGYTLWQPEFNDAGGWAASQFSRTLQLGDIDGDPDHRFDVCAVGPGSTVLCARSTGSSFGSAQVWLTAPSELLTDVAYYGSVRLADVSGDGKADLCFRLASGVQCALSNGSAFDAPTSWAGAFSDAAGWKPEQYSTTIQFADLDADGRADVCGRGFSGLYCGFSNGTAFIQLAFRSAGMNFPNFSDYDGFAERPPEVDQVLDPGYYSTLRLADVTGDAHADACIRSAAGVLCAVWEPVQGGFDAYRVWQKADFRDGQGWSPEAYALTFMLGDVTGDGRADLCARRVAGLYCVPAR